MGGQNRGPVVLAVTASMIAVSSTFVLLRMISRFAIVRRVKSDDYCMILAWAIALGLSIIICYGTSLGLGQHEVDVLPQNQRTLSELEYAFTILYNPALMATKTSIGIFYLSLSETQKVFKWLTIATLVVLNAVGISLTFLSAFQCHPLSDLFLSPRPSGAHCTDIVTLYLSSAPVNIITDLALLMLPMPLLKQMHLPRKQKIILYVTFGFGVFVTAVDVVRVSYLQEAARSRLREKLTGNSSVKSDAIDFPWYASFTFMWSAIEVNVGIMCACVPALKPLFARFLPNFIRSAGDLNSRITNSISRYPDDPSGSSRPSVPVPSPTAKDPKVEDIPEGQEMGFMDFLNASSLETGPEDIRRVATRRTVSTKVTNKSGHHFDFVKMGTQKPFVDMSNRESILPIVAVTVLFFLWGFAYGLLNTLNAQFQLVAELSSAQDQAIHAVYYVGYFVGPLTFGRLVLKIWGFKACFMVGLVIYGIGTLIFWPSAVLTSFPAFLISNFIVGAGLSTLEIAANPFIALCGPLEYAEARLNFSQAVQACGTVVSPLLAKKVLFNNVLNAPSLVDTQWTYLAITLFTFFLAFVYYCIDLPEADDEDFARATMRTYSPDTLSQLQSSHTIQITLLIGVFAQFCYVAGQEAVSTSFEDYVTVATGPRHPWDLPNTDAIAHTLFAASRFLAGFLCVGFQRYGLKPRYLLAIFMLCAILFSSLAASTSSASFRVGATTSVVFVYMVYFFEGPLFSLIYAISLRALGELTKDGSALMTAAISGGAPFSPIALAIASSHGIRLSFVAVAAAYAGGFIFPIYLNVWRPAKTQVDPIHLPAPESDTQRQDSPDDLSDQNLHDPEKTQVVHNADVAASANETVRNGKAREVASFRDSQDSVAFITSAL